MKQKDEIFSKLGLISLLLAFAFFFSHLFDFSFHAFPTSFSFFTPSKSESLASLPSLSESLSGAGQMVLGQKININTASTADLEALPVIGPKLAQTIVQDRQEKGRFVKVEDLMRVKGIKEKKFDKLKDFIRVK